MTDLATVTEPGDHTAQPDTHNQQGDTVADHAMEIVRDEQRKRGWYLSWRCTTRGCDARGNLTAPSRDKGLALFELVAAGHARTPEA